MGYKMFDENETDFLHYTDKQLADYIVDVFNKNANEEALERFPNLVETLLAYKAVVRELNDKITVLQA